MKVAITGAAGFLGRHVVDALAGHEFALLGRDLARLKAAFSQQMTASLHPTDYSTGQLEGVLSSCDAVVHLAAERFERGRDRLAHYAANVAISENIFAVCEAAGVSNVVFASTCSIYDPRVNHLPFSEDQRVSPPNRYAISKLAAEQVGRLYAIRFKSLRIAQLVGWGERDGFMLKTFLGRVRRGEPLEVWGAGQGQRDYLYVRDAAAAITAALARPRLAGVFNVGSERGVSHGDLAEAIVGAFDPERGRVERFPDKPADESVNVMDCSRARRELGWSPRWTLEAALAEMKMSRA